MQLINILQCANCNSTNISVEGFISQNQFGCLQIDGICDKGHVCLDCYSENIKDFEYPKKLTNKQGNVCIHESGKTYKFVHLSTVYRPYEELIQAGFWSIED